ncbi:ABC transporter substrate-binding protein [Kutzneria viridogrisea]|uniref:Aliphatic sulfonates family ABC transporter periplasmic ligand-binding protein n=2 Tax=Kutzneria TaxID=43356 RepID=W5W1H9_9PSEU|nr:ABC transporter substrate-binding protein [Kutzneria albida]AHH95053.1 aliphatic sulfonates family ABC transporter periplasmic ligand-binding protein [Kutzneria albida DSM 43870]MBA8927591.1 NitT/TauT family transport system substrate-binding protein [Kutzneria viridogrisea]
MHSAKRRSIALVAAVSALVLAAACSRAASDPQPTQVADQGPAAELHLGYFPNVTHAAALIGQAKDFFSKELGSTKLVSQQYNAGPDEVSALLGKSLDAAFIGSGPAINAFAKSDGQAVRLVAGATSGGAQLVVRAGINGPADLKGKTVNTPQLANTQDIALKKWLSQNKLTEGAGADQVKINNTDNAQTLDLFKQGKIDGAWLPAPWSSRLVLDAGAKVLLDERSLWPEGKFPTTVLVVRTEFLQQHPKTVEALLRGELAATEWALANKGDAEKVVNDQLKALTGKALSQAVLDDSWNQIALTVDPLAGQFPKLAADQVTAGVVKTAPAVKGFADLTLLNKVLQSANKPAVDAAGLDKK